MCEVTAEETELRSLARLLLWADESSPLLLPQATTKASVNPRPPPRIARDPKPIRRLTLEAGAVCLKLGGRWAARGAGVRHYCP